MALFVIVLAAAEAAVALAIALNFYNNFDTIDVDRADQLQGLIEFELRQSECRTGLSQS